MTGARFNELLRIKLDQFQWSKGKIKLNASKTEDERELPLWDCIRDIVQRRISEGLTDGEYLFPRAKVKTFDNGSLALVARQLNLRNSTTVKRMVLRITVFVTRSSPI